MNTTILQVAAGGALGASARYCINLVALRLTTLPLGTFCVNVLGCLIMGVLAGAFAGRGAQAWAPFLMTGVLGGFTTFSAFSLDALALWQREAAGLALGYVLASVVFSLAAVCAGLALGRGIFA